MQKPTNTYESRNALPQELFDDLAKRLENGTLRTAVGLREDNGNTTMIGQLTGLTRFIFGGEAYDVLSLIVEEPTNKKRYSRIMPAQTKNVTRSCPLEAVARIQIFGYNVPDKFAIVYERA